MFYMCYKVFCFIMYLTLILQYLGKISIEQ